MNFIKSPKKWSGPAPTPMYQLIMIACSLYDLYARYACTKFGLGIRQDWEVWIKIQNPKIIASKSYVKYVSTKCQWRTSPARSEHGGTSPGSALVTTPSPPGYEPPEVVQRQIITFCFSCKRCEAKSSKRPAVAGNWTQCPWTKRGTKSADQWALSCGNQQPL